MTVVRARMAGVMVLVASLLLQIGALADGTRDDYARANALRERYQDAAPGMADSAAWVGKTHRFWYRRSVKGGHEFILVDAETQQKQPAFDHTKLAASLSQATGNKYTSTTFPFNTIAFADQERALEVRIDNDVWTCTLADYVCKKPDLTGLRARRMSDGPPPACDAQSEGTRKSPDGKWEARISDYNVAMKEIGKTGKTALTRLSTDGSEANCYTFSSLSWSPDSRKLAAYRTKPGYRRMVHYVESSPEDQLQPKHTSRFYAKPGDVLDVDQPVIFHVQAQPAKQIDIANTLFPNPYDLTPLVWRKDSEHLTFEYNQRGHQVYRVIEVEAASGRARTVISDEPKTFFDYPTANGTLTDSGKKYRYDLADGHEIIWMSERDGWNHLYLVDGATGAVKRQITKGPWVVRGVQKVDEETRQIWFSASGMDRGKGNEMDKDPYFSSYYRINIDGTGLTRLTNAGANHTASYSSDMKYYTDLYSRVDAAPVLELHRVSDNGLVAAIEHGTLDELRKAGWKPPQVFTAMGRDGKTDIWGIIYTPANFDPARKYPVVEQIYAGPQGSFVPKSFNAYSPMQSLAELGFVVVQIDGMGTSNRSKAFHDVAWQNLKDAGFEDRILWHKAAAANFSWYDISRVGIYGTSAGGQSALGALLFHPEFYKAAVSAAGCHDNRMDKIWWNELWMGWPIGPQYAESSNVDNAYRLQGALLLIVGEMDTNVDPSSTFQVVNQLIKHKKDFDFLLVPGMGHGSGGPYGERRRFDFFVQHLLGKTPPAWNADPAGATPTAAAASR